MSTYPFDDGGQNTSDYWNRFYTPTPVAKSQQDGSTGSMTPVSTANATTQSQTARSSDNPFTEVLNHVSNFNAALGTNSIPEGGGPVSRVPDQGGGGTGANPFMPPSSPTQGTQP